MSTSAEPLRATLLELAGLDLGVLFPTEPAPLGPPEHQESAELDSTLRTLAEGAPDQLEPGTLRQLGRVDP